MGQELLAEPAYPSAVRMVPAYHLGMPWLPGAPTSVAEVLGSDLLRDAHRPRVEDQLAEFVVLEGGEADLDPLEPLVGRGRREELVRFGGQRGGAFLAREADADRLLVAGDRKIDDLPDAELALVA